MKNISKYKVEKGIYIPIILFFLISLFYTYFHNTHDKNYLNSIILLNIDLYSLKMILFPHYLV